MSDESIEGVSTTISFFQGSDDIGGGSPIESIKQKIAEFSNVKNVSFLLGAGTSSGAIPSMKSMHEEISKDVENSTALCVNLRPYSHCMR